MKNCKNCGVPISGFFRGCCEKCAKENVKKIKEMQKETLGEFMPEHKSFKLSTSKSATRLTLMVVIFVVLGQVAKYLWGSFWIRDLIILAILTIIFYYPIIKKISKKENITSEQKPLDSQ